MTRVDQLYDRFRHTWLGRIVTHPAFLLFATAMSIASFVIALYVLYGFTQQNSRTANIASQQAAQAVRQAQVTQKKAAAAQRATGEAARLAFCKIIVLNASNSPPPTTARGFAFQAAYAELGKSPVLHCFDGKS